MKKAVNLPNGRSWPMQKLAIAHFRDMLARYVDGASITNPSDHDDLKALLQIYDAVLPAGTETKTGSGIDHFSRQVNGDEGWSTSGFHYTEPMVPQLTSASIKPWRWHRSERGERSMTKPVLRPSSGPLASDVHFVMLSPNPEHLDAWLAPENR